MKSNALMHKKIIMYISLVTLIMALSILTTITRANTLAWFQSKSTVVDEVKTNYSVALKKNYDSKQLGQSKQGDLITKEVSVVNTGNTPVYVRIHYTETFTHSEEGIISNILPNGKRAVSIGWSDSWDNEWMALGDGWYYYKRVLDADSETPHIIKSIQQNVNSMSDAEKTHYKQAEYRLDIVLETIQIKPDAAVEKIWSATATGDDNNISWQTVE